jgi:hypothetical protein
MPDVVFACLSSDVSIAPILSGASAEEDCAELPLLVMLLILSLPLPLPLAPASWLDALQQQPIVWICEALFL